MASLYKSGNDIKRYVKMFKCQKAEFKVQKQKGKFGVLLIQVKANKDRGKNLINMNKMDSKLQECAETRD